MSKGENMVETKPLALKLTAAQIVDALIAGSDDKIWASELPFGYGVSRIDFWTLEPTPSAGFRATSYEIKVSRSDFSRDTEEKQKDALSFSDRFWYVTPKSLLRKEEIPTWAGLLEFDGSSFCVVKRAPKHDKTEPNWHFIANLVRNSGRCRRDTALLKSQLAFHEHRLKREEGIREHRRSFSWDRAMAREERRVARTALSQPNDEGEGK